MINQFLKEIEDNFAVGKDVDNKYDKVTKVTASIPRLVDMKDGETQLYVNGATKRRYYRVGSRLFYSELTEVT